MILNAEAIPYAYCCVDVFTCCVDALCDCGWVSVGLMRGAIAAAVFVMLFVATGVVATSSEKPVTASSKPSPQAETVSAGGGSESRPLSAAGIELTDSTSENVCGDDTLCWAVGWLMVILIFVGSGYCFWRIFRSSPLLEKVDLNAAEYKLVTELALSMPSNAEWIAKAPPESTFPLVHHTVMLRVLTLSLSPLLCSIRFNRIFVSARSKRVVGLVRSQRIDCGWRSRHEQQRWK